MITATLTDPESVEIHIPITPEHILLGCIMADVKKELHLYNAILALLRQRPMSREEIQAVTGITARSFQRALKRLRQKYTIYTVQTGAEFVYELDKQSDGMV